MSLDSAKGNAKLARCEHGFTDILEILAFAIHPGTSENTTTLCLRNGMMLMTSQGNLTFEGINAELLKAKLKVLQELLLKTELPLKERIDAWWSKQCVLSTQVNQTVTKGGEARSKETIEKSNTKIELAWSGIFQPMMQAFFGSEVKEKASLIKDLAEQLGSTEVVLNEHIFRKAPSTTGFHGESRILRYLFIKWATGYLAANAAAKRLADQLEKSRGDPEGKCRLELIRYMERKFVSRAREWGMVFGSSQGTCTGCCLALDICFAKRGKKGNLAKQWLDPLDLSGFQGVTTLKAVIREHALNMVLLDFDRNSDEVPEDWSG